MNKSFESKNDDYEYPAITRPQFSGEGVMLEEKTFQSKMGCGQRKNHVPQQGIEYEVFVAENNGDRVNLDTHGSLSVDGINKSIGNANVHAEMHPSVIEIGFNEGYIFQEVISRTVGAIQGVVNILEKSKNTLFPFGVHPKNGVNPSSQEVINFVKSHPDSYYQFLKEGRDGVALENLDNAGVQFHFEELHERNCCTSLQCSSSSHSSFYRIKCFISSP